MGHTRRAQGKALLGVLSVVAAAACGGGASGAAGSARATAGGTVTLRATEFKFEPATIRIAADKPVRLVLANQGMIEHDVEVERMPARDVRAAEGGQAGKVAAHAQPGKQARVEFTPTAKGTYELVCTIPGHKDAGMRGQVIVE